MILKLPYFAFLKKKKIESKKKMPSTDFEGTVQSSFLLGEFLGNRQLQCFPGLLILKREKSLENTVAKSKYYLFVNNFNPLQEPRRFESGIIMSDLCFCKFPQGNKFHFKDIFLNYEKKNLTLKHEEFMKHYSEEYIHCYLRLI